MSRCARDHHKPGAECLPNRLRAFGIMTRRFRGSNGIWKDIVMVSFVGAAETTPQAPSILLMASRSAVCSVVVTAQGVGGGPLVSGVQPAGQLWLSPTRSRCDARVGSWLGSSGMNVTSRNNSAGMKSTIGAVKLGLGDDTAWIIMVAQFVKTLFRPHFRACSTAKD